MGDNIDKEKNDLVTQMVDGIAKRHDEVKDTAEKRRIKEQGKLLLAEQWTIWCSSTITKTSKGESNEKLC